MDAIEIYVESYTEYDLKAKSIFTCNRSKCGMVFFHPNGTAINTFRRKISENDETRRIGFISQFGAGLLTILYSKLVAN